MRAQLGDTRATVVDMPRQEDCPAGCTGVHSYTDDGRRWCWVGAPSGRAALDVELRRDPPAPLARRLPRGADFWAAWTHLEVAAKLTDTPVLTLIGRGLLGAPGPDEIAFSSFDTAEFSMCLGRLK